MTNHFRRLSRPIQADPDDMRHLHISRILSPNGEPNFEKPMTDMSKKWLEKYYDVPSNSWRSIQFMCIYLYIYNMLYIYTPLYTRLYTAESYPINIPLHTTITFLNTFFAPRSDHHEEVLGRLGRASAHLDAFQEQGSETTGAFTH